MMEPADYAELNVMEEEQALLVASEAQKDAADAVSSTFVAMTSAALKDGTGQEKVADVAAAVSAAVDNDALSAAAMIQGILKRAKAAGYEAHLLGLAHIYNADERSPAQVDVEVMQDDLAALDEWPILGHRANVWAAKTAEDLAFVVKGIAGEVAMGGITLEQLPGKIRDAERLHAMKVRGLADNAYLAGTAAAQREWEVSFS